MRDYIHSADEYSHFWVSGADSPAWWFQHVHVQSLGMTIPSQVSILCGGPDWPTSVLAGILRLSLVECEIGTLPEPQELPRTG